jgi:prephenate dehydratase
MIKNYKLFEKFEKDLISQEKADFKINFKIVADMYEEAVDFGVFPLKNSLEGIEVDIKIGRIINYDKEDINKGCRKFK